MTISCCVILYYPNIKELQQILLLESAFDKVYVYDNTDKSSYINYTTMFDDTSIEYISYGENKGLAVAYNELCNKALEDGSDYLCIYDQDSVMTKSSILEIKEFINNKAEGLSAAIIAPKIVFNHKNNSFEKVDTLYTEVKWVISSGSFINLEYYKKTEGFDENYFIDRVDLDYCDEVRKLGYKIIQLNNVILKQSLGELTNGFFRKNNEHSVIRHYYICRNKLYHFNKKYRGSKMKKYILSVTSVIRQIYRVLFNESEKMKKIKMMITAIIHYKQCKMGKYTG